MEKKEYKQNPSFSFPYGSIENCFEKSKIILETEKTNFIRHVNKVIVFPEIKYTVSGGTKSDIVDFLEIFFIHDFVYGLVLEDDDAYFVINGKKTKKIEFSPNSNIEFDVYNSSNSEFIGHQKIPTFGNFLKFYYLDVISCNVKKEWVLVNPANINIF